MKIPQNLTEVAQHLGYPSHLFGFTPQHKEYWQEPGLPWWTAELRDHPPLGYNGLSTIPFTGWIESSRMAPRFPKGCAVMLVPVYGRENLVLGKVYTYSYRDGISGELAVTIGRLAKIGGNYLETVADNPSSDEADCTIWLLREDKHEAAWDVREVSHYVSYPALL